MAFKKGVTEAMENKEKSLEELTRAVPTEPYKKKPLIKTKFTNINDRLEKIEIDLRQNKTKCKNLYKKSAT